MALAGGLLLTPTGRAADVGYAEDFALAKDRAAALARLIPGTEDYYYYHCLHLLNAGRLDELDALTKPWVERHGQTARLTEVRSAATCSATTSTRGRRSSSSSPTSGCGSTTSGRRPAPPRTSPWRSTRG